VNIWQFSALVSARLLAWATASTLIGILLLPARAFWRGFGAQAAGWGLIDAGIALAGVLFGNRRRAQMPDSHAPAVLAKEAHSLRRLLWINAGLDVLYVLGGWLWARRKRHDAFGRGTGWGIVVQGAFLLAFDVYHALRVPRDGKAEADFQFDAFNGPEHKPFYNEGGKPAALLVHGFPGTPAEMRPLADALHAEGWTVEGILLPGFGEQINTLEGRTAAQWTDAVESALKRLQATHSPVIVIGNSLGGALSLAAARAAQPDGVVLLNPFSRLSHPLWSALPVLKLYIPAFNPFSLVPIDMNDPEVRAGMAQFMPGADLDDPAFQRGLKQFAIPTALLDELRRAGANGEAAAPLVTAPALVLQGSEDQLVSPKSTQTLTARLGGSVTYHEVECEHNLLDTAGPSWDAVRGAVTDFARRIAGASEQS
jgi:carboxylesterase